MAGLLIRMRLAMLRHQAGGWWGWKTWVGLGLALVVLANVPADSADAGTQTSVVALLLAMWTLGMVLLALQSGTSESDLLPQHFALLPIPPRRLAVGLFAAAAISPGTLVLVVASGSLLLSGLRLGTGSALMAVPALVLHVLFCLVLTRVLVSVAGLALRTRIGVEMVALQWALLISLSSVGWLLLGAIGSDEGLGAWLDGDMPSIAATTLRLLPTGWGAVAVGAVGDDRWWLAALAVLGLCAINVALLLAWARIIRGQLVDRPSASARARWAGPIGALRTPLQATIWRETLRWFRDPRSAIELRVAYLSAIFMACIPLAVGWNQLLPFAGAILVVMAALAASNAYGLEGSALWLVLMAPGSERIDVRARQGAFVLLFGPVAVLASAVLTLVTGLHWAWPWWLAAVPGGVGIAAGVMILIAVHAVVPVPEAARRSGDLMATGDTTGPAYLTMLLVLLLSVPALTVTWLGVDSGSLEIQAAGIVLGLAVGVATFWWCGERAIGKLERDGPELLAILRHGAAAPVSSPATDESESMPLLGQVAIGLCWTAGMIAIVPQSLVAAVFRITDQDARVWFLPLFLPEPWQWPAILGMFLLGVGFIVIALRLMRRFSSHVEPATG